MKLTSKCLLFIIYFLSSTVFANHGVPVYCDSSAGREVLNNGNYSQRYCRFTAVMDYQTVHSCCSWNGGVFFVKQGNVVCKDGTVSSICSTLEQMASKSDLSSDDSVMLNDSDW